jgi:hypothetical protein
MWLWARERSRPPTTGGFTEGSLGADHLAIPGGLHFRRHQEWIALFTRKQHHDFLRARIRAQNRDLLPGASSKGAPPSASDIGTNFLKSMFNDGDTGPKAPASLRMQGSYGGQGGMLLEFYPESAVISPKFQQ